MLINQPAFSLACHLTLFSAFHVAVQLQVNIASAHPHSGIGTVTRPRLCQQRLTRHNLEFITGQFYRVSAHCALIPVLSLASLASPILARCVHCPLPLSLALTTDQVSLSAHFSGSPTLHMSTSLTSKHFVSWWILVTDNINILQWRCEIVISFRGGTVSW